MFLVFDLIMVVVISKYLGRNGMGGMMGVWWGWDGGFGLKGWVDVVRLWMIGLYFFGCFGSNIGIFSEVGNFISGLKWMICELIIV